MSVVELKSVTKYYGRNVVLRDVNWTCRGGVIYGLAGYNGSGKTTLLKTMAGIFRHNRGDILADGVSITDNESFLRRSFLVSEELLFNGRSTPDNLRKFYSGYYPGWNDTLYMRLMKLFGLDRRGKVAGFSKGMQRQTGLLLALSTMPEYLFLDETFDGLDISKRIILTEILKRYAVERNAVVVITSHYLNELEDVADEAAVIEGDSLVMPDTEGQSLESYFLKKSEADKYEIDRLFK